MVATYLANLSPPEDSVGHDLGLVVLPWGGHIERSRNSRPSSGHSSGGEVISERSRWGYPKTGRSVFVWFVGTRKRSASK